jgi:dTDP-4-amino-4,6-dideoxy-D-galactose acyltransferase
MLDNKDITEAINNINKRTYSPFDYIRSISIEGDNLIYSNELSSFLGSDTDISLKVELSGRIFKVIIKKLEWDSNFFGFNVAKILDIITPNNEELNLQESCEIIAKLVEHVKEQSVKYLLWQIDTRATSLTQSVSELGFCLIETRLHYYTNLLEFNYPDRYDTRLAKENDIPYLSETAVKMVNIYDRFHADSFIKKELADKLMAKWVEASILKNFADATLVPNDNEPKAFCTVKFHKDKWQYWKKKISQPVFSAVGKEFRGWYKKIISELNYLMKEEGAEFSFLITQASNKAVIHTWETLGYKYGKTENVFRKII